MAENKLKLIFDNASNGQKIIIASVLVSIILFTTLILKWTNKPEMSLLYSNLSSEDAGSIVEKLDKQKINYEFKGGNSIFVPKGEIHKLRISLANEGLPSEKGFGYEILQSKGFGTTEFLQKINFRRALEAEIAQTIMELEPIQDARLHIVMPDPALFQEDEKPVTAGITLKLSRTEDLSKEKIQSIVYLVSSSVEGLNPQNITVVDTKGNILSSDQFDDLQGPSNALTQKIEVENYLTDKVSSMLDNVLGPDNSVVRVSVELDMESLEKTEEKYDPDTQVARSETITESSTKSGEQSANGESEDSEIITNYEISKSINHLKKKSGKIKNLSISVLIDGTYIKEENDEGNMVTKYIPRTNQEIADITSIVENSVGSDLARGDRITVRNMQFETKDRMPQFEVTGSQGFQLPVDLFAKVFTLILLGLGVFLIKSILKNYDLTQLTANLGPQNVPTKIQTPPTTYERPPRQYPHKEKSGEKSTREMPREAPASEPEEQSGVTASVQAKEDIAGNKSPTVEHTTESSKKMKKLAEETQDLELEAKRNEMNLRKKALENLEQEEKNMELDKKKKMERLKILKDIENLEKEIQDMENSMRSGSIYSTSNETEATEEDREMKKLLDRKRKALERREQMKTEMELLASIEKKPDPKKQKRNLEKKKVVEYIKNNPDSASAILRSWLSK